MPNVSRTVRLGGLAGVLAVGAATTMLTSASAVPAGGAVQIATSRPDLVSARITQGVSTTPGSNTTVARAQACYDASLNSVTSTPGQYRLEGYDQGNFVNSVAHRVVLSNPNCVEIDFESTAGTIDLASFTLLTDTGRLGLDARRRRHASGGSAALEGSRQSARNGGDERGRTS